jgi:predicted  nucleic acid-binding Zn-ribbon protein
MLSHAGRCGGNLQVNPALRNLISLQDIDHKISHTKKQIAEIPSRVESYREEFRRLADAYQAKLALSQELVKQRRSQESDVEMMRTKLSRLKDQLMTVRTNKEYTAMLHEIQTAEEQIRAAEDEILEVMERLESMESDLAQAEGDLKARELELEERVREAEDTIPRMEVEVARLNQEREALESLIGTELLARYHRIAEARKGLALAEARDELCSACHVRIRPQVLAELIKTEDIHVCDSCSRILFVRENAQ